MGIKIGKILIANYDENFIILVKKRNFKNKKKKKQSKKKSQLSIISKTSKFIETIYRVEL